MTIPACNSVEEKEACNRLVALETKVCMLQKLFEQRFEASELALTLSREGLDHRLNLLNELRSGVLTKAEYDKAHDSILFRIVSMEKFQSRLVGIGSVIVIVVAILGAMVGHLWK